MAQLVVSSAAAAATFVATGGNVFAANLAFAAAGAGFSAYKVSKQRIDGPRLTDAKLITANFGEIIPYVIGAGRVAGQVWWQSEIRETATTQEQGKGGGPKATTYSYSSDVLFGLASNVKGALLRVFLNGKLVWSQLPGADQATIDASADSDLWDRITFYGGSETQLPDPTYEAAVGTANAVAYRGRSTVFIENLQLGNSGQIPNLTFEVGELADLPGITINYKDLSVYDAQITREGTLNDFAETAIAKFGQSVPTGANSQRFVAQAQTPSQFEGWSSWTAECWFYLTAHQTNSAILSNQIPALGNAGFALRVVNNKLSAQLLRDGFPVTVTDTNDLPLNQWHHVRMRVTPTYLAMDLNGSQVDISTITGSGVGATGANLGIGQNRRDGQVPFAYFDEVRISKIERTGPAPSARFVVDADTVFLWRCDAIQTAVVGYPTLRETVEDLCARSGLPSNAYDASALASITQPVRSVVIGQVGAARATLESLRAAFYFDVQLSDKLYFVPRATTSVSEIGFADLAAGAGQADAEPFSVAHSSDLEIPAQVGVRYVNVDKDYQDGLEISDRGISGQATQEIVDIPIGLLPSEAKTLADGYSIDNVAALTTGSISLPITYSRLLPADVVTVRQEDGSPFQVRLTSKREEDFVLTFEWRRHDALSLLSAGVTDISYSPANAVVPLAETLWQSLDIPLLREADDGPGFYVQATPDSDAWPGAAYYISSNNVSFSDAANIAEPAVFGTATSVLPDFAGGIIDEVSTVTVNVGRGQLSSVTRDELLANRDINAALLGDELIRFISATLISAGPNIYRLSRLLRGQRGTEWAKGTHANGERFALLTARGMRRVQTEQTAVNALRYVKAVTLGRPLASVTALAFTNTGRSQQPLDVALLRAAKRSVGSYSATWQRRTRYDVVFKNGLTPTVPLGEVSQRYQFELRDAGNVLLQSGEVFAPAANLGVSEILSIYQGEFSDPFEYGGNWYARKISLEEGGTNFGQIVRFNIATGAVLAATPTFDGTLGAVAYSAAGFAYCLTIDVPSQNVTGCKLHRVNLATLAVTHSLDIWALGTLQWSRDNVLYDGTDVWTLCGGGATLRKHSAADLSVSFTRAFGNTSPTVLQFSSDNDDLIAISGKDWFEIFAYQPSTDSIIWTKTYQQLSGLVLTPDLVFVAETGTGLLALDATNGEIAETVTGSDVQLLVRPSPSPSLRLIDGNVAVVRTRTETAGSINFTFAAEVLLFDQTTAAPAGSVPLDPNDGGLRGSINGGMLMARGGSGPRTTVRYGAPVDISGCTLTVWQMSATVGRGRPASIILE